MYARSVYYIYLDGHPLPRDLIRYVGANGAISQVRYVKFCDKLGDLIEYILVHSRHNWNSATKLIQLANNHAD